MSILNLLAEGGQTWAHRVRMLKQVLKIAIYTSFSFGFIAFLISMSTMNLSLYQSMWYHLKGHTANALNIKQISVSKDFWTKIAHETRLSNNNDIDPKRVIHYTTPYRNLLIKHTIHSLEIAEKCSLITLFSLLVFFFLRGRHSKRKKHISGKKFSSAFSISLKLRRTRQASGIKFGSLPLVKGTETQHMLITGGTGSGKTNCLFHLLDQIRKMNHKAVIVDTSGAFIQRYYRKEQDKILNPFDKRCVPWHPWAECKSAFDYEALAESFIPQSHYENENYWRLAAKSLFSTVLQKTKGTKKTSDLSRWILFEPLSRLCAYLEGTKSAAHMDLSSEKTAGSIRSVCTSYLECLEHLTDTTDPFSIHDWIKDETQSSWLFLNSMPAQRTSLQSLMSAWISIAIRSLLEMESNLDRRVWFIIDEMPTLNKIRDLLSLLTEGRKYGGCGVIALQGPSQIESIYGRDNTKTIIGNCSTKVVFSEQDPEIAEMISRSFGEREIKEYQEGISYGAHEVRDGVSLSLQTKNQRIVTPTQIQSLKKNQAFVKLPGNVPVSKIKLSIK